MSSSNAISKVVTVDEQAFENAVDEAVDEGGVPVVGETPAFQATVEQETQAKVDANHPDGIADTSGERIHGVTLAQEERIRAREAELERISAKADLGTQDGRARRTRAVAAARSEAQQVEFQRRAASVRPEADPDVEDPRAELSRAELAAVNREAARLAAELDSWSRAAVGRRLGATVAAGADVTDAVIEVFEALQTALGHVVPIGNLADVDREAVSVEGRVTALWESDAAAIQQVGLVEDDSGTTKFTSWVASNQP